MHESIHAIHDNYFGHGGSRSVPEHFCTSGNGAGLPGPACKQRPAHIPFKIHPKCPSPNKKRYSIFANVLKEIIFEGIFFVVLAAKCIVCVCACVCVLNTLFYVEMRRNPVFTKTYTVNVCFWRLGWLSDKRVSRHRVWEEGAGLLRGGSGGFLPGGSFGCCSFPVELCLPVRLWNPINLLSSLLRSIPRLWLLQYH